MSQTLEQWQQKVLEEPYLAHPGKKADKTLVLPIILSLRTRPAHLWVSSLLYTLHGVVGDTSRLFVASDTSDTSIFGHLGHSLNGNSVPPENLQGATINLNLFRSFTNITCKRHVFQPSNVEDAFADAMLTIENRTLTLILTLTLTLTLNPKP